MNKQSKVLRTSEMFTVGTPHPLVVVLVDTGVLGPERYYTAVEYDGVEGHHDFKCYFSKYMDSSGHWDKRVGEYDEMEAFQTGTAKERGYI